MPPPNASPIFNNVQQLLDLAINIGTIPAPEDVNMISQDEFETGEEVIILVEGAHSFIFKRAGIIEWFNNRLVSNNPLVNPFTNTVIIRPGSRLSTINPAVRIQVARIAAAPVGGRRRRSRRN
jgi:hypothetical protein